MTLCERAILGLTIRGRDLLVRLTTTRQPITPHSIAAMLGSRRLSDFDRATIFELTSARVLVYNNDDRTYSVPGDVIKALADLKARYEARQS